MIDKAQFNKRVRAYNRARKATKPAHGEIVAKDLYTLVLIVLKSRRIYRDKDLIQVCVLHTFEGLTKARPRDPFAWAWTAIYRKALNEHDKDNRRTRRFPLYDPQGAPDVE
jgi:DNA-directed RNA polymerase specialized sigma24 family protein